MLTVEEERGRGNKERQPSENVNRNRNCFENVLRQRAGNIRRGRGAEVGFVYYMMPSVQ